MSKRGERPYAEPDAASARRAERRARRGTDESADWSAVELASLREAISAVTSAGCKITLGYGGDGGSYSIGILGDGEPYTDYIRPTESIEAFLSEVVEYFTLHRSELSDENAKRREKLRRGQAG